MEIASTGCWGAEKKIIIANYRNRLQINTKAFFSNLEKMIIIQSFATKLYYFEIHKGNFTKNFQPGLKFLLNCSPFFRLKISNTANFEQKLFKNVYSFIPSLFNLIQQKI